jgi:hypothetical protein
LSLSYLFLSPLSSIPFHSPSQTLSQQEETDAVKKKADEEAAAASAAAGSSSTIGSSRVSSTLVPFFHI